MEYLNKRSKMVVLSGVFTGVIIILLIPGILHSTSLSVTASEYLKYVLFMSSYYVVGKSCNDYWRNFSCRW